MISIAGSARSAVPESQGRPPDWGLARSLWAIRTRAAGQMADWFRRPDVENSATTTNPQSPAIQASPNRNIQSWSSCRRPGSWRSASMLWLDWPYWRCSIPSTCSVVPS